MTTPATQRATLGSFLAAGGTVGRVRRRAWWVPDACCVLCYLVGLATGAVATNVALLLGALR